METDALASDYRIAYQQLQYVDKQAEKVLEALERDRALALKRYRLARTAFLKTALNGDDEYLVEGEEELPT